MYIHVTAVNKNIFYFIYSSTVCTLSKSIIFQFRNILAQNVYAFQLLLYIIFHCFSITFHFIVFVDVTAGDMSTLGSEEVFPREESQSAKQTPIAGKYTSYWNILQKLIWLRFRMTFYQH